MSHGLKAEVAVASVIADGYNRRSRRWGHLPAARRSCRAVAVGCDRVWVALAVVLPLTFPSLTEMAQKNPVAILPADAPANVTTRQMTEAFDESGSENILLVLLTNDKGLGRDDETVYRALVDKLRQDTRDVVMLQDFISTPPLREVLASKDGKAWLLPLGLAGELGSPESYAAYNAGQLTSSKRPSRDLR